VDYDGGSFSKSKTQVATVQIDLFVKDALTNQIIAAARGSSEKKQQIKQSLGFGAGAGANLGLAQRASNEAMEVAVEDLLTQLRDNVQ
jgi:curli biogenesis system outer membrane secretion channel CsgG